MTREPLRWPKLSRSLALAQITYDLVQNDRHRIAVCNAARAYGEPVPRHIPDLHMPEMLAQANIQLWGDLAGIAGASAAYVRGRQGYER